MPINNWTMILALRGHLSLLRGKQYGHRHVDDGLMRATNDDHCDWVKQVSLAQNRSVLFIIISSSIFKHSIQRIKFKKWLWNVRGAKR